MKTPSLLAAAACAALPVLSACVFSVGGASCTWGSWESIHGSGIEASEAREVPAFRRIHLSGSADVVARAGAPQALSLRGDDNLLQFVQTEVRGETLHIGMQPGNYSFYRGLVVEVSVPELDGLSISGSSTTELVGVSAETFDLALSGSGDVKAAGTVGRLSVSLSGSGDLDLFALHARQAQVQITGSGDVLVDVEQSLAVQVSGSGDVRYGGQPQLTTQVSGSGSVSRH